MSDASIKLSSRGAFSYHWNKCIESDDIYLVRVVKSVVGFFQGLFGGYTVSEAEINAIFNRDKHGESIFYKEYTIKLGSRKAEIVNDFYGEKQDVNDGEPATKKEETVFTETNTDILTLIENIKDVEERIGRVVGTGVYKYPDPNPGDIELSLKLKYWKKRLDEVRTELSGVSGTKIKKGNTGIADLSDDKRPEKLIQYLSKIYDNQWTDLLEDIQHNCNVTEDVMLNIMYESLIISHDVCKNNKESTMDEKEAITLKKIKGKFKDLEKVGESINEYVKACVYGCTHMLNCDPPLVFGVRPKKGANMDTSKYREYISPGEKVGLMVWPCLYRNKGGTLLSKGTVKAIDMK